MTFLSTGIAVAAVASIALPIVIHLLFRRRRVPLDWAAMELLRAAVRRTNRRLQVEQWIVLALRSLAVLAAGLAIAAPILRDSVGSGSERLLAVVVVDDGATSGVASGAEPEFTRIRGEVAAFVAALPERSEVAVVRAGLPAEVVLSPTSDRARVEEIMQRLEPLQTPSDLKQALALARGIVADDAAGPRRFDRTELLVASSFRRASVPDRLLAADGSEDDGSEDGTDAAAGASANPAAAKPLLVRALVPAAEAPLDVRVRAIDARPLPTGGAVAVRAVVSRTGASLGAGETRVRASGDGLSGAATRTIAWEAGQTEAMVEFLLMSSDAGAPSTRRRGIEVALDGDALLVGNRAFAVVDLRRDIEVAVVGRRGTLDAADIDGVPSALWIARALAPGVGSGLRVREIDPANCDARALVGADAVVVTRPDLLSAAAVSAVSTFVGEGRIAVIVPSGETRAQGWSSTVLPALRIRARFAGEAVDAPEPLRLAEEQPASALLAAIRAEIAALVAPIEVRRRVPIEGASRDSTVLAFADGSPLLVVEQPAPGDGAGERGRGLVALLAVAPELAWTNLPIKPLMVPLVQETVRAGLQLSGGSSSVAVGARLAAQPSIGFTESGGRAIATDDEGVSREIVPVVGLWRGDDGTIVAANAGEGSIDLAPVGEDAVRAALAPLGAVEFAGAALEGEDSVRRSDSPVAPWLFALALLALIAEGVLSRVFSHASTRASSRVEPTVATVGRVRTGARAMSAGGSR